MESLTLSIDNSTDELIKLIKYHVERRLSEYNTEYGVDLSYDLRDSCIMHTYKTIQKKYQNDSNFEDKKEKMIKLVAESYICGKYLDNQI